MKKTNLYRVSYKNGLHCDITVEAVDANEATKMGVAEYRRHVWAVDTKPASQVINDVVEII